MVASIDGHSRKVMHIAVGITLSVLTLHLAGLVLLKDEWQRLVLSDVAQSMEGMAAAGALFLAARASRAHSRRLALAWGVLALAQFLTAMGDTVYGLLEIVFQQETFPSLADPLYLCYYPIFIVGVILLPATRLTPRERNRTTLDLGMVMLSAMLVFWNFWIGPTVYGNTTDWETLALSVAYPVLDLMLLFALLLLLFRRGETQLPRPQLLLAAGAAAMIGGDFLFSYRTILGEYHSGELTDILWAISFGLCFLAGILEAVTGQPADAQANEAHHTQGMTFETTFFPFVWLLLAWVLLTLGYNTAIPVTFPILTFGFGGIAVLAVTRQILVLVENGQLTAQLSRARDVLETRVQERTAELALANRDLRNEITQHKRAEEALAASEDRYRTVVEQVSEGIILYDMQTNRVLEANPAYARLLGYALDEMRGLTLYDIVAADRASIDENLKRILAQRHYAIGERQHRRKDGSLSDVEVTGAVLSLAQQEVLCIVVRDISARKRAEQARELEATRHELLLELHKRMDTPPQEILDFAVNAAVKTIQSEIAVIGLVDEGASALTIVARSPGAMAHSKLENGRGGSAVGLAGLWGECIRERKPILVNDYDAPHPNKRGYPAGHVPIKRYLGIPIFDGSRIVALAGAANKAGPYTESDVNALTLLMNRVWEILRRKRVEDALAESESKLRNLIEQSVDAITLSDEQGRVVTWNSAAEKLTGFTREEMLGKTAPEIQFALMPNERRTPEVYAQVVSIFDHALREAQSSWLERRWEGEIERPDGTRRYIEQSAFSIKTRKGFMMASSSRDITERKKSEERLLYLSTHDTLTGLYNRSFFEEELTRMGRGREFPMSILMADVNGMKQANDTQGHSVGDELLCRAARVLQASLRAEDVIARIGGDEFAALLPNTDAATAAEVVARIMRAVESDAAPSCTPLSCGLGIATAAPGMALAETLKQADMEMYADKIRTKGAPSVDSHQGQSSHTGQMDLA